MNRLYRSGAIARIGILRNGTTYIPISTKNGYKNNPFLHQNTIDSNTMADRALLTTNDALPLTFYTLSSPYVSAIDGTFSQTDDILTRISGTSNLNSIPIGDLIKFDSGQYTFKVANIDSGNIRCSNMQIVSPATSIKTAKTFSLNGNFGFTNFIQSFPATAFRQNPVNNSYHFALTGSIIFLPTLVSYTLRRIYAARTGNGIYSNFELDDPIQIGIGDSPVIETFDLGFEFSHNAPKSFTSSPIEGLSGSGRYQRLIKLDRQDTGSSAVTLTPNKIWTITVDNQFSIPDILGYDYPYNILPLSSITFFEEISATGGRINASSNNTYTQIMSCYGISLSGGAIKQIAFGNNTAGQGIYGIIEYDSIQGLSSGNVIYIRSNLKCIPNL